MFPENAFHRHSSTTNAKGKRATRCRACLRRKLIELSEISNKNTTLKSYNEYEEHNIILMLISVPMFCKNTRFYLHIVATFTNPESNAKDLETN